MLLPVPFRSVDQWPRALSLDADAWEAVYHFPKLGRDDLVILACRTNRRSAWAAQVAEDVGLRKVFVLNNGTYGWRLDPGIEVYEGYKEVRREHMCWCALSYVD
jgi:rhodanese-related sulfurtransferase